MRHHEEPGGGAELVTLQPARGGVPFEDVVCLRVVAECRIAEVVA